MTSTIIALSLLTLLMLTLELAHRASDKHTMELKAARADIEGLKAALELRTTEARRYAADDLTARELLEMAGHRIDNLCGQLEESRKGRKHYYDESAEKGKRLHTLESELFSLKQSSYANLSGLGGLSALQQENKLDALCEVIKTLMQRDQLCDAAVASFGGRLSRAVQVYRKDRLKAIAEEHMTELGPTPCLIPGLTHLMGL